MLEWLWSIISIIIDPMLSFANRPVVHALVSSVGGETSKTARSKLSVVGTKMKGRILVYSVVGCPHCMRAKSALQELNLTYSDINLDSFPQCRDDVARRTGKKTVPQIFFNNHLVGGNDELQKLIQNKAELDKLIAEVKNNPPPKDAPVPPDPSTAVKDKFVDSEFKCEPDEYAALVHDLRQSGLIKNHRQGMTTYKNSFCGKDFVNWVVKTKKLDRPTAIEMGQQLIDKHFGHHVKHTETFQDDVVYYRLLEDDHETNALNAGSISDCDPRPAGELGEDLRRLILKLYNAFLSKDGKAVDYDGIGGADEFNLYLKLTKELQRVQLEKATREEKLAFFINVYNALVVHATVVRGPATNLWQRYKFFYTIYYIIGGHTYCLQDIENGVLRANRKGVGMITRPFGKSDPRLKIALEQHEPLIHFALVCGAKSCPPIKTYAADGIYDQMKTAAEAFFDGDDGMTLDMKNKHVKLSAILKWYREDFGSSDQEVLQWINDHMSDGDKKNQLAELLAGKKFKISYLNYNWDVNAKKK
ncbi:uncharacterized protein LOC135487119 [Lineus longissimus]|uniref:uncharacterized protein LOC135487119 n=1 Tax=Lineus longissimus TaxID=88925 RepID=UPI002B4E2C3A